MALVILRIILSSLNQKEQLNEIFHTQTPNPLEKLKIVGNTMVTPAHKWGDC